LIAGIFNITHSESLGKYLGCPIFQQRTTRNIFQGLINKETTKLEGWKANCLSKAGQTVLIQSHLEALPAHTIQCFKLPIVVTNQLDSINREFFWKRSNAEKGLKLIAWDKVCMPKVKGGLGLRKTEAINKAFQCKLAWKILTDEDSIWVRVKHYNFLSCPMKTSDSPVWKSLLKCRQLFDREWYGKWV